MCNNNGVDFRYTRKQAIADGFLVDVSEPAKEAGFAWPVAITRPLYDRYVAVPPELNDTQNEASRLHDLLLMLWLVIRVDITHSQRLQFKVLVRLPLPVPWLSNEERQADDEGARLVTLKGVGGPDDDRKPCVTVMHPWED